MFKHDARVRFQTRPVDDDDDARSLNRKRSPLGRYGDGGNRGNGGRPFFPAGPSTLRSRSTRNLKRVIRASIILARPAA